LPQKPASGEKTSKPLFANLLSPRRPSHGPTVRQCRSNRQFSRSSDLLPGFLYLIQLPVMTFASTVTANINIFLTFPSS